MKYSKTISQDDYDKWSEPRHVRNILGIIKTCPHRFEHPQRAWEYGMALNAIRSRFPDGYKPTVLEVGGGGSAFSPSAAWVGMQVLQIDPGDHAQWVKCQADAIKRPIEYVQQDLQSFKTDKRFDAVTCLSVIEHVPEHEAFFEKLCSLVKPGGLLIITTDFYPTAEVRCAGHLRTYNEEALMKLKDLAKDFEFYGEHDYTYHGDFVNNYTFGSLVLKKVPKFEALKVSCICPTYNRVAAQKKLIDEAVESFLRQTYPNRELIILNDHPGQEIVFDHPLVRVVNHPQRFPTLGDKYNFGMIELATGDALCTWEDDDISLPNRLEKCVELIQGVDYFNPKGYWFLDGNGLHHEHPMGYAHNCSLFRREAFLKLGGYPKISGPQDAHMDGLLRASVPTNRYHLSNPRDWYFIYRWGVSNIHLSAFAETQKVYDQYAQQATATGKYVLEPRWEQDYVALVKHHIEINKL